MTNYFKWQLTVDDSKFLRDYWENSRGGDNLWSVYWLYNITGDSFLLELAEKIHRCTADWTIDSRLPNWHNVNVAQCFREPATYYMLSGDSAHLAASYNVHALIRRCFGQVRVVCSGLMKMPGWDVSIPGKVLKPVGLSKKWLPTN